MGEDVVLKLWDHIRGHDHRAVANTLLNLGRAGALCRILSLH